MLRYGNLSGQSNVTQYELQPDGISVCFGDGSCYLYTNARPGPVHVAQMQRLAQLGRGLNSYISRFVKRAYTRRLR